MLAGKKILLGITGSIAAYKTPILVRLLIKAGAEVRVLMTPASKDFVSPLTLATLSKNEVLVDLFTEENWANHVMLGRWADVFLIAPLSCTTLSKMSSGQSDNLLMSTYLSSTCDVVVAPAMDEDMWHHPSTKRNLDIILQDGCKILPVVYGELASGLIGEGRMAEPEDIVSFLENYFVKSQHLSGKRVLVTAGPTYEAIDPVRFISNHSSGKMGLAIVEELCSRGASVILVSGPIKMKNIVKNIDVRNVRTAEEMYNECLQVDFDIAIMAAAVADYTPAEPANDKIKKSDDELTIKFKRTKDILATLGKNKKDGQVIVGFALETQNGKENSIKKLKEKNADLIVLNSLNESNKVFGSDENKVTLFFKNGNEKSFEAKSKALVAKDIVDSIIEIIK